MTLLAACATEGSFDPLEDYEQLQHAGVVNAPAPVGGQFAPADRDVVERGRYLVALLGCGACHTNGAFEGAPDVGKALAGSRTGIGLLTDAQVANAIRAGSASHGKRRLKTMPWQGYALLTDDDVDAIVAYLRAIPAIEHKVPAAVSPGQKSSRSFVYFGVYRKRN